MSQLGCKVRSVPSGAGVYPFQVAISYVSDPDLIRPDRDSRHRRRLSPPGCDASVGVRRRDAPAESLASPADHRRARCRGRSSAFANESPKIAWCRGCWSAPDGWLGWHLHRIARGVAPSENHDSKPGTPRSGKIASDQRPSNRIASRASNGKPRRKRSASELPPTLFALTPPETSTAPSPPRVNGVPAARDAGGRGAATVH
jgi:hypothetical protein